MWLDEPSRPDDAHTHVPPRRRPHHQGLDGAIGANTVTCRIMEGAKSLKRWEFWEAIVRDNGYAEHKGLDLRAPLS